MLLYNTLGYEIGPRIGWPTSSAGAAATPAVGSPGHQIDERIGVVCVPLEDTLVFDVNQEKIHATKWSFDNIDTVEWA